MNHKEERIILLILKESVFRPLLKIIICILFRPIASIFFKPYYLKGKFFDESVVGWKWVWRSIWLQKLFGFNRYVPWPVSPFIIISDWKNITFNRDDLNNFQTYGCYFQNSLGKIEIGKGTYIAPNVGIITSNHDFNNLDSHLPGEDIIIEEKCWIGMNSVILPGVHLGPATIVGAGTIVTKSFPEGNCVIAGVPAKLIRKLNNSFSN